MEHASTASLSAASICALACLVPGVAAANGSDATALANRRNSTHGKRTRRAGPHTVSL
jgi:hypothetical protein